MIVCQRMCNSEKISVVVPVYNVSIYLDRCLNSLICQNHVNIEIILVDDGSTDCSGELCEQFALNDSRVKVIHKENGGLSDARNVGLAAATGGWIFLLDSDDYISPYCLSRLLDVAISQGSDIVECQFSCVGDNDSTEWTVPDGSVITLDRTQALSRFLDYDGTWVMAWNKLYKSSLFEGVAFPKGRLNEDEFTTPFLVDSCNSYSIVSDQLYAYYQRPGSIMHSGFSDGRLDVLKAHKERFSYFSAKYSGAYDGVIAFHWFSCLVKLLVKYREDMSADQLRTISSQQEFCLSVLRETCLPFKRRVQVIVYRLFPWLGVLLAEKGISRCSQR